MTNDKLQVYDFQAEVYISRTQDNIELLRKYSDPVTAAIARNLEQDLEQFKKEIGYVTTSVKLTVAGLKQAVTHTANPDGTVKPHPDGMSRPKINNLGFIMKKAALEDALKVRHGMRGVA